MREIVVFSGDSVTISSIIGDVAGRDVIVLDDEIARGTTLMELLSRLREQHVRSVSIACTHGLFVDGALGKLVAQPDVIGAVRTNTVPVPEHKRDPKLDVISEAPRWPRRWPRPSAGSTTASRSVPFSAIPRGPFGYPWRATPATPMIQASTNASSRQAS